MSAFSAAVAAEDGSSLPLVHAQARYVLQRRAERTGRAERARDSRHKHAFFDQAIVPTPREEAEPNSAHPRALSFGFEVIRGLPFWGSVFI